MAILDIGKLEKTLGNTLEIRRAYKSDMPDIMRLEHLGFAVTTWEDLETFEARLESFNDC